MTTAGVATPGGLSVAVTAAVGTFGALVTAKFATGISSAPEDQMRAPLEALLTTVAAALGLQANLVGRRR